MFRKMVLFGMACGMAGLLACAGPGGKGEGESCSSQNDCSADLTCQPIGSRGDFCCPTPPDAQSGQSNPNCTASGDGG
jgi:hypothetical protein